MDVSSVSATTQSPFTGGVGKSELEREDFMTLFVTQLQYQDPLKPMDSYEMASQLAQFSSMEATMKMSDNMEELLAYQTSQNNLQLLTLLDQQVTANSNQISVNGGAVGTAEFNLAGMAQSCVVNIYDVQGRLVRSIDMGVLESGSHAVAWDGLDFLGSQAPDGAYGFVVEAYDPNGEQVAATYSTTGLVTGVDYASGQAVVTLDGHLMVGVADVLSVQ